MAMRGTSTQLECGPILFACKTYSAHESTADKTCNAHTKCGGPLSNKKWCAACNEEAIEISKGYKVNSKTIVTLTEAEINALPVKSQREIEVVQFFKEAVDTRSYSEHLYYIGPDGRAKAYLLLMGVMAHLGLKALARFRRSLYVIEPFDGVLMMREITYESDLRSPGEIKAGIKTVPISAADADAITQLVDTMVKPLAFIAEYTDSYTEALEKLVEDKMSGKVPNVTPIAEAVPSNEDTLASSIMAYLSTRAEVRTIVQPACEVVPLVLGVTPEPVDSETVLPW